MKRWIYNRERWQQIVLLLLFTIHYSLFTASAQIGTWHQYLAYRDVQSICKAGNELFVLASDDLYQYNLDDQSIQTYDKTNGLSDTRIRWIAWSQQAGRLIAVYQNSNIDLVETNGNVTNISALYTKTMTEDKTVQSISIEGIYAYLTCAFGIVKVDMKKAEIAATYTENMPDYPKGLTPYHDDFDAYISTVSTLSPGGPAYNHFYEARHAFGKLYTTGGYFLPSIEDSQLPGIIQTYDGNNWTLYDEQVGQTTGNTYVDICCIDVDPNNENHVFAAGRCGLYEFNDGKLTTYYNKDNSPLKGANDRGKELGNDYVLVLGLKMDKKGSLWVLNCQANGTSLLELTADHQWKEHHQALLTDDGGISYPGLRSMILDSRGLLWFVNTNWANGSVFCYDPANDTLRKYASFVNQDQLKYSIAWVYCVAEDRDGNIWVGTESGPFMIDKNEVGQESVTFQQIKVPRNDGTNYADYLLSGVSISSIAIDGGNRKWFGTNGAGTFLISADNMQQLHNFTTSNSKLISNNITSIAINQQSGEVFFLSDQGLCSYQSDATEPAETMEKDNVWAYPNPVTPDYTGLITVTGLSFNSDVKIVAANGALIAEGRSNGGLFTWDGCDKQGRRVASGIYFVISATSEGKSGTCCKIAVIN